MNNGKTDIAFNTQFTGELHLTSPMEINGEFEGSIYSDNAVTIGADARVTGKIEAQRLIVNGYFNGSAKGVAVDILSRGNVHGKLVYHVLTIEAGGNIIGETNRRSEWDSDMINIDENKMRRSEDKEGEVIKVTARQTHKKTRPLALK